MTTNQTALKEKHLIQSAMRLNNFHPDEPFKSVSHVFSKGTIYRPTPLEYEMSNFIDQLKAKLEAAERKHGFHENHGGEE